MQQEVWSQVDKLRITPKNIKFLQLLTNYIVNLSKRKKEKKEFKLKELLMR